MLAPAASAARATPDFTVSIEIGTLIWLANRSMTGITRRSSSASATGKAPGRVDSPPTSIISAPCSTSSKACATAAGASRNRPPSENESGVMFRMPITSAGRGKVNSNWQARSFMKARPETQNPKLERKPKPEGQSPKRSNEGAGPSDFGLRPSFGFRVSAFGFLATRAATGHLNQLDLISLRGVDERNAASVCLEMRPVGVFQAEPAEMPSEVVEAVHLKGEVGQVRLHLHRAAGRVAAKLDQLLAARRLEEHQL